MLIGIGIGVGIGIGIEPACLSIPIPIPIPTAKGWLDGPGARPGVASGKEFGATSSVIKDPAMPKLVLLTPEFSGQGCELPQGSTSVGRGPQNQIILVDPSVSANHCDLLVSGSEVIVREHGSSNGTFVDGRRVEQQAGVNPGSRLRLGDVEAMIQIEPDSSAGPDVSGDFTARFRAPGPGGVLAESDPIPAPRVLPVFPITFSPRRAGSSGGGQTEVKPRAAVAGSPAQTPATGKGVPTQGGQRVWPWVVGLVLLAVVVMLFVK
jgi:hypothetical protein